MSMVLLYTPAQAARALGVSEARLRERLADGSIAPATLPPPVPGGIALKGPLIAQDEIERVLWEGKQDERDARVSGRGSLHDGDGSAHGAV